MRRVWILNFIATKWRLPKNITEYLKCSFNNHKIICFLFSFCLPRQYFRVFTSSFITCDTILNETPYPIHNGNVRDAFILNETPFNGNLGINHFLEIIPCFPIRKNKSSTCSQITFIININLFSSWIVVITSKLFLPHPPKK